jgi:hypothetical protein
MGDVLGCVGKQQEGKIQAYRLGLQWEAQAIIYSKTIARQQPIVPARTEQTETLDL